MPPHHHRITRFSALVLTLLALATACGTAGGVDVVRVKRDDVDVRPTPSPVPVFTHPITGVAYEGPQDWQQRRALAVKIENSAAARPQAGLEQADLVYEELVEGGITRFVVVFHTRGAERIGPIRSARHVDPDIVTPLSPLFAYSGAVPPVIEALRAVVQITDVGVDRVPGAYYRDRERNSPHNLFSSTKALREGRDGGDAPQPMFSFLPEDADPTAGGESAASATFAFANNSEQVRWSYEAGEKLYVRSHRNTPHTVEGGDQVTARNVLVQRLASSTQVLGEGEALLFRDGHVFSGRWIRGSVGEPTHFVDADGEPLLLAPGNTWIELLPSGRPVDVG